MKITNAKFETSAGNISQIKQTNIPEIAFVGKSNVGKSTLINYIVNQKNLAKTSKEPGKTRLVNYFELNNGQFYFVDLPGYGFAKVSLKEKEKWSYLIESYFEKTLSLVMVFVLIDSRRTPSEEDIMMVDYLYAHNIPFSVIATKADKITRSQMNTSKKTIAAALGVGVEDVILVSSFKKTGKEEVLSIIKRAVQI
ncbi:MAG TPA: YihA family ribosome biogenesis GTP-binding protein [Clostridiales bacterium]|nr:YihA family ribosome biogenesis GTP-binding protein [Clostridiales bacterium]